ncbi:hypothetical protein HMSSN139_25930 [Paenibacillus sp. HMSSN-139]|nr:hypothetical protein HMSSN139_25930 [Paenibacillus sp. HMSSN-139]
MEGRIFVSLTMLFNFGRGTMERTFLMVKPDGVQRGLVGRIISRFEDKGFQLIAGKLVQVTEAQAKKHYAEHEGKPFFDELVGFITSGPVFAMVWGRGRCHRLVAHGHRQNESHRGASRHDSGRLCRPYAV